MKIVIESVGSSSTESNPRETGTVFHYGEEDEEDGKNGECPQPFQLRREGRSINRKTQDEHNLRNRSPSEMEVSSLKNL